MTTTNPFRYKCGKCDSPWNEDRNTCWNCGSYEKHHNPDFGQPIAQPNPLPTFIGKRPDEKRSSSMSPDDSLYLLVSLAAGIVAAGLVYFPSKDTIENIEPIALFTGLIVAANCWIVCLIIMTKSRVDRLTESNQRIEAALAKLDRS